MNRHTTKKLQNILTALIILAVGLAVLGSVWLPSILKYFKINLPGNGLEALIIIPIGFSLVLGIVVLSFVVSQRQKAHRQEDLKKLARQNSWNYTESMNLPFLKEFDSEINNSWFGGSNALTASSNNVLMGIVNGRNIIVSDQIYSTGSGRNRTTHEKTLIGIELREAKFPFMCLYPEGFFDKVFDGLSKYDIDFGQFPNFSQKYVLYGKNESHIRSFFNPQILSFYEQHVPFNTACGGKYLVIWGETLLNPAQIMAQLNFLFTLANLFLRK